MSFTQKVPKAFGEFMWHSK